MKYDSITNIIVLGESYVGKTLFINNYINNKTKIDNTAPTIGVDYYKKTFHYQDNTYLFKLWDTGNGLLYKNILDFYFKSSSIFIILTTEKNTKFIKSVFDVIHTDSRIKPEHIFIIYNKKNNYDTFNFNKTEILNFNLKVKNIYFNYLNVMNNSEVVEFFNQIKFIVFSEFINTNKYTKSLIPLNTTLTEDDKHNLRNGKNESCYCCTIC